VGPETQPPPLSGAIALVSPPWPLYTRPSIQLGTLKAFVRSRFPNIGVRSHHLYLQVAEAIGLAAGQVELVYGDIDAKRKAAFYSHQRPLLVP